MKTERKTRALYLGRQLNGDKVAHAFLIGKKVAYFSGIKWIVTGHEYEAVKTKDGVQMSRKPEDFGQSEKWNETLQKESDAHEARVRAHVHRRRAASSAKSKVHRLGSDLLKLRELTKGMDYAETKQFIEFLVDKVRKGKLW